MSSLPRIRAVALWLVAAVVLCSAARAEVINIEVTRFAGSLEIVNTFFLRADDPQAHFSLATLGVEEIAYPSTNPTGYWWDLEIKVTRATAQVGQDVMIAIDKDVINQTPDLWTDFHMTLGRGIGDGFAESDEFDFLYFKNDPPPVEKTGSFHNPPMTDEPVAPDNLWWFWDPPANPGQPPGALSVFWMGINVPDSLFGDDPTGDRTMATFTLRQHATIPEPSSLVLAGLGAGALFLLQRRRI